LSPYESLPAVLDVGTARSDLRGDEKYFGVTHDRLRGEPYFAFLDRFVAAVKKRWPRAVLQWEDLSKDTAFAVLERYRAELPSFNDDIQGTGAVTLAGALRACALRGESLADARIAIHGAGAGGAGVAWALWRGMVACGLSEADALSRIFVLDSKGLLVDDREGTEEYKRRFAQSRARVAAWSGEKSPGLEAAVKGAKITMLVGLSGQAGAFDEAVIRAMGANAKRPIVFPLSNPTSSCEGKPADILAWTEGRAIVATGSPFAPVDVNGAKVEIGQGNNAFIFPGLGLGAVLSEARAISDAMVLEAAYALAAFTESEFPGRVYPPVSALREASMRVAVRVAKKAIAEGLAAKPPTSDDELASWVRARAWTPKYLPFARAR
jgi:malate dehydrogenase (oxaloacetate-decarboxylating)